MLELFVVPLGAWLLLMLLASGAGLALVGAWPWAPEARKAGVALAAGVACAPLLAGLAAMAVLWAVPGVAPRAWCVAVYGLLGVLALAGLATGATKRAWPEPGELAPRGLAAVLCWGYLVALLLNSFAVPLIQNDALEYATAARILFDARDLASYPALQPQQHPSGFYGPWTHPPLYVALLALGDALQGGSESTLLLRFVAPWALAGSVACVAALARWASPARPDSGPLAALLLVSAPMLFLGAASALIDALPVLGLTLAFTALAALRGAWWQRGLGLGALLGLALWTHSQAVLFPLLILPLLLIYPGPGGVGRWSQRVAMAFGVGGVALAMALLVGAAPYVRNLALFGAPVSDNPIVFALPSLDWPAWFREQRGLGSKAELVQYGLLKPWFAVEAYAIVFWLALPALFQRQEPLAVLQDEARWLRPLALGLIGLYLAGALLSLALGIDLMVRNERYMLILLPMAALLAAGALKSPVLRTALVVMLGLQLAVLMIYRLGQLDAERGSTSGGSTALQRWGPYGAVDHLRRAAPSSGLVLSMKPADMFYSGRTMLSYLDPRLVPFYGERDAAAAAQQLAQLGVTQVHLPDYWLPPVYNSALEAVLARPDLSELEFEADGYQVYRLRHATGTAGATTGATAGAVAGTAIPACGPTLSFDDWQQLREFVLGGRKNLRRFGLGSRPLPAGEVSRSWNSTPFFLRETNTVLRAEVALPNAAAVTAPGSAVAGQPQHDTREWLLRLELQGEGHVQALVRPRGAGSVQHLVADRVLVLKPESAGPQLVQRRLRIDTAAQRVELRLEHRAGSQLRVQSASLVPMCAR